MKVVILGAAALVLTVAGRLQLAHEAVHPRTEEYRAQAASLRMPPAWRQAFAFGFRASLSDLLWLDAIQYYGTKSNEVERERGLYPILDTVTDLDPRFEYAYQFGGEAIPYHDLSTGAWFNTKAAIALLQKGVNANPVRWELPWLLGFNLYTFWGRYKDAGEALLKASDLADKGPRPGTRFAPPTYLRSLALRLLAQGNDVQLAIDTTTLAIERATSDERRMELMERLRSLTLQQDLEQLRSGRRSVEDLSTDPFGAPYFRDAAGQIRSTNEAKLLRLQLHPGQPAIEKAVD